MQLFVNQFTLTGTPTNLATLYNTQYSLTADTTPPAISYLGFKGTIKAVGGAVTLVDQGGHSVVMADGDVFTVDGCDLAKVLASGNTFHLRLFGTTSPGW